VSDTNQWFAASGSGSPKRNWWVGRIMPHGQGTQIAEGASGRIRRFTSLKAAQKVADSLNYPRSSDNPGTMGD
jgi:hypothetical protein